MPGNEPYYGATDAPLKYTLGRYDFEVGVSSGGKWHRILMRLGCTTILRDFPM